MGQIEINIVLSLLIMAGVTSSVSLSLSSFSTIFKKKQTPITNDQASMICTASNLMNLAAFLILPNLALWQDGHSSRICIHAFHNGWKQAGGTKSESIRNQVLIQYIEVSLCCRLWSSSSAWRVQQERPTSSSPSTCRADDIRHHGEIGVDDKPISKRVFSLDECRN